MIASKDTSPTLVKLNEVNILILETHYLIVIEDI